MKTKIQYGITVTLRPRDKFGNLPGGTGIFISRQSVTLDGSRAIKSGPFGSGPVDKTKEYASHAEAMAAIRLFEEQDAAQNQESETRELTETQTVQLEKVTTGLTLAELEAEVEKAYATLRTSSWQWAVAITKIHDSKLFPGANKPDGWAAYMEKRWDIGRAQAFNYVAWVHNEIKLVPSMHLEDEKSTTVDSTQQGQPETPQHKTERASRSARSSQRAAKKSKKLTLGQKVNMIFTQPKPVSKANPEAKVYILENGDGGFSITSEAPEKLDDTDFLSRAYSEETAEAVVVALNETQAMESLNELTKEGVVERKDRKWQLTENGLEVQTILGRAEVTNAIDDGDEKGWNISREVIFYSPQALLNGGIPCGIFRYEGNAEKKKDAENYAKEINENVNWLMGNNKFTTLNFLRAVIRWAKKVDRKGTIQVLNDILKEEK